SAMIAFMGGSWFVTVIVSTIIYNMMMAPYFTPAVVSGLSKVKELLSASTK
ncbi:conjugal transfer protein TraS, partial [Salmonella enterica]|nr:conjugal transfer protein TraS [Salmonella enterica]